MSAGTTTAAVELEIFSDVVCPWCYIGETKLKPAVEQFRAEGGQVQLRLRPFLLNPDFTGPSRPLTEYLRERFGDRADQMAGSVTEAGAAVGLDLRMARAIAAGTLGAHQLIEAAYDHGGFDTQLAVAEELFADHFTRGRDVADAAVLAAAGERAGLPADVIADAAGPRYAEAVRASLLDARAIGITAVPTFVANRALAVQGAQPGETLLALLRKAAEYAAATVGSTA